MSIERDALIDDIARRLATILGLDTPPRDLVRRYVAHVESTDLAARSSADLAGLMASHLRFGALRTQAEPLVSVRIPDRDRDGWAGLSSAVVQVVTDDREFIVDTITLTINTSGWSVIDLYHPQFIAQRDLSGRLTTLQDDVTPTNPASGSVRPTMRPESWVHAEILAPLGQDATGLVDQLATALHQALTDVEVVAEDSDRMRERLGASLGLIAASPVSEAERRDAAELLTWLADDHLLLLGSREYTRDADGYRPLIGSGLGVLRADGPDLFDALPQTSPADLLVITKDSVRSSIHRSAFRDYIGIRLFDEQRRVAGERRFVGLLTSSAYHESINRIPPLARKVEAVLQRSGYDRDSHGGKAILDALDAYPRDELFQASVDDIEATVVAVIGLRERRQLRVFVRRERWSRFASCLVYFPRDRYNTTVRVAMEGVLRKAFGARAVDYQPMVSESVLARLWFVVRMPAGERIRDADLAGLQRDLAACTRTWDDDFLDAVAALPSQERGVSFSRGYRDDFDPHQGVADLQVLNTVAPGDGMALSLVDNHSPASDADLWLRVFRVDSEMRLSDVMPHLLALGVGVVDEWPYDIELRSHRARIYDFGLALPDGVRPRDWGVADRDRFNAAFAASWRGESEPDQINRLITLAGLSWPQAGVLRAIARYLQQAQVPYSQSYLAAALVANPGIARDLVTLFETRFDPDLGMDPDDPISAPVLPQTRELAASGLRESILASLDAVGSLDHDRILRQFLAVIDATVRTDFFVPDRQALAFKISAKALDLLPQPRPMAEIFVTSPRVEGIHLRFGKVARGGLRWSDRAEDFRTEVLGLVKAQTVKNSVIVPVGAKGGFFPRRLPDPLRDRTGWQAEGEACYRIFVDTLLGLTDNRVGGAVVPPARVVRHDGDDPYLVVAADKGTATFSDVANQLAVARDFWLGDAFASGGSAGYDHKAMGITARGAWESVKRHFAEMGIDCQSQDFTCVGIGDMAGDVFGNGMLLSRHIRLVAAFNHRHILIDPDPDAETSYAERERLFRLPGSSWADYDRMLLSAGGGIFERSAKSIRLGPEAASALGLPGPVKLPPNEVISAILRAPVDLLWNGGIGTYVKAASETHQQVSDKANDGVRVNADKVRARCVGEGGNLGWTQLARIEYAQSGGRINTDFIDNSAGVDTSDHEVNIKILLSGDIAAGRLTRRERDRLLASMTDDVASLVLSHNIDQNIALANAMRGAASMAGVHEDWIQRLESLGYLDRTLESLPTTKQMEARIAQGRGLTCPELATLLAWTKIMLVDEIAAGDLPEDPFLADRLLQYFPAALRERDREVMVAHPLHREIITTVAVNRFVNSQGITAFHRLSEETGSDAADVIRAQLASRSIFRAARFEITTRRRALDAGLQAELRVELRRLVERGTRWVLANCRPIDIAAAIARFEPDVHRILEALPEVLTAKGRAQLDARTARLIGVGVDADLAGFTAGAPFAPHALPIAALAQASGVPTLAAGRVYFSVAESLGLDDLMTSVEAMPRLTRWGTMARSAVRDDLLAAHAALARRALDQGGAAAIASPSLLAQVSSLVRQASQGDPDLARISVALRAVRGLLPAVAVGTAR